MIRKPCNINITYFCACKGEIQCEMQGWHQKYQNGCADILLHEASVAEGKTALQFLILKPVFSNLLFSAGIS